MVGARVRTSQRHMDTNMTKTELGELAQGYVTQLRNLIYEQGITFLEIGRLLKIIRDEELFKYLGDGGYDSFKMFLAGGDIGLKPSSSYALIEIYDTYVLKLGYEHERLAQIPWTRLQALSATIKAHDGSEADEWLAKAETLGNGDFMTEIREARGNAGHEHPIPFPTIYRCKDCGLWRIEVNDKYKCVCIKQ